MKFCILFTVYNIENEGKRDWKHNIKPLSTSNKVRAMAGETGVSFSRKTQITFSICARSNLPLP